MPPDLSIITYVKNREDWLVNCCVQVQSQKTDLRLEHIVFYNDCGYQGIEKGIARHVHQCANKVQVFSMLVPPMSELTIRDYGTTIAQGNYICYWNYGNYLSPEAADLLHAASKGFDVGLCQVTCWFNQDFRTVPQWNGKLRRDDLHYAGCCFRREAIRLRRWEGTDYLGAEYRVIKEIQESGGTVNFCPRPIGTVQGHY